MITFSVTKNGNPEGAYSFRKEKIILGRQPECDVVLADARVSRKHAVVERRKGVYTIADVYSANGTVVDNRVISACALRDGAEIVIEPFRIGVKIDGE
jgi:pSer/pThr/pTyr-binding forkhead associated (FHA) protein